MQMEMVPPQMYLSIIENAKKTKAKRIDLSNRGLMMFPPELLELDWLEEIILCNRPTLAGIKGAVMKMKAMDQMMEQQQPRTIEEEYAGPAPFGPNAEMGMGMIGMDLPAELQNFKNLKLLDLRGLRVNYCPDSLTGLHMDLNNAEDLINAGKLRLSNIIGIALSEIPSDELMGKYLPIVKRIDFSQLGSAGRRQLKTMNILFENEAFLEQLQHIEEFDISGLHLEEIPTYIYQQTNKLKRLYIGGNDIQNLPEDFGTCCAGLEELHLMDNGLRELPDSFKKLQKLKVLDLSNNSIRNLWKSILELKELEHLSVQNKEYKQAKGSIVLTEVPKEIENLAKLRHLDLSSNEITELPEQFAFLQQLRYLNLERNNLNRLPDSFGALVNLETLDLDDNILKILPLGFGSYPNLTKLYLRNNQLESIPDALAEAKQLDMLVLEYNKLTEFPKALLDLPALQQVNLKKNKITKLPKDWTGMIALTALNLEENQLENLPLGILEMKSLKRLRLLGNKFKSPLFEIIEKDYEQSFYQAGKVETIFDYLLQIKWQGSTKVYEAKLLIVGEPDAGKTTLRRRLVNASSPMPTEEETTKGIDIEKFTFENKHGQPFRVNMWDFGGQAIYHSTHQFFLTRRSMYVLVLDTRKDDDKLDYWLRTLELFAEDSPIIIVQNQKADRTFPLNESSIKRAFPNVKAILGANLSKPEAISPILETIEYQVQKLDHVGMELPNAWIRIRQHLEDLAKKQVHIDLEDYLELCKKMGMPNHKQSLELSQYFHDFGVFLHFQEDIQLSGTIFLQNDWVTGAIYKVLDSDLVKNIQQGRFSEDDLEHIWADGDYAELKDELLNMMIKFEICYHLVDADEYIVPQLLSPNAPEYEFPQEQVLTIRYTYDFMPRGIITDFVVRMYHYIPNQDLVWKEGVVLERLGVRAEIVENRRDREISIRLHGANAKDFLIIIQEELERIHRTYHDRLEVQQLLPCICSECKDSADPYTYEQANLERRLHKGKETIECENSYEEVNVRELLGEVSIETEDKSDNTNKPIKILFLAANPRDTEELRLTKEAKVLKQALKKSKNRDQIDLEYYWATTFDDLQEALLEESNSGQRLIIHFSGHGTTEYIIIEDQEGFSEQLSTEELYNLLEVYKKDIHCLLINSCYSKYQAEQLSQLVPFVVGSRTELNNNLAVDFTVGFYRGLGSRMDVHFAFNNGKLQANRKHGEEGAIIDLWVDGKIG